MKKLLSLILAAFMVLSCASVLAEQSDSEPEKWYLMDIIMPNGNHVDPSSMGLQTIIILNKDGTGVYHFVSKDQGEKEYPFTYTWEEGKLVQTAEGQTAEYTLDEAGHLTFTTENNTSVFTRDISEVPGMQAGTSEETAHCVYTVLNDTGEKVVSLVISQQGSENGNELLQEPIASGVNFDIKLNLPANEVAAFTGVLSYKTESGLTGSVGDLPFSDLSVRLYVTK